MNNKKLKLYIQGIPLEAMEYERREFLTNELNRLQERFPIEEDEILINTTHVQFCNNDIIKVSFFIRNATAKKIFIKNIPVNIISKEGEIISFRAFQLKKPITIEAYSAGPYKIDIDKSQYDDIEELKNNDITISVDSKLGIKRTPEV